jgi:hypothetical protein
LRVFRQAERLQSLKQSPEQASAPASSASAVENASSVRRRLALIPEASSASIKGQPSVDALKQFFSEQSDRLNAALQDAQSPPWLALHHAAVSLDVRRPVAHTGKAASD